MVVAHKTACFFLVRLHGRAMNTLMAGERFLCFHSRGKFYVAICFQVLLTMVIAIVGGEGNLT